MREIKFIYFEINQIIGDNSTENEIENINVLLIKPKTNSSGVWGYTNMTERKGFSQPTFSVVNQYWIDLDKFEGEKHKVYDQLKKQVDVVMEKINSKLRTVKLNRLFNEEK